MARRHYRPLAGWLPAATPAVVLAVAVSACSGVSPWHHDLPHADVSVEQQRGVALPTYDRRGYDDARTDTYLRQIEDVGARWVQVNPTWYQETTRAHDIASTSQTPTDAGVAKAIALAHAHGLKVLLKPHVDLRDGQDRAVIRPDDPDRWFASYAAFITHYARLAGRTRVEEFAVGTELAGVSNQRDRWLGVVRAVRSHYSGPLVYAANYDEYLQVAFWDALDLIGVNAFWPLGDRPSSDPAVLRQAWRPMLHGLAKFAAQRHRRILFTEAGYTSQRGATTLPYSWTVSPTADWDEQAAAYQALLETFSGRRWWAGVFWWAWDLLPSGSDETSYALAYTPRGKAAESVLRAWWSGGPRRPASPERSPRSPAEGGKD